MSFDPFLLSLLRSWCIIFSVCVGITLWTKAEHLSHNPTQSHSAVAMIIGMLSLGAGEVCTLLQTMDIIQLSEIPYDIFYATAAISLSFGAWFMYAGRIDETQAR